MFPSYEITLLFIQVIKPGDQKHYALNHCVLWEMLFETQKE